MDFFDLQAIFTLSLIGAYCLFEVVRPIIKILREKNKVVTHQDIVDELNQMK